MSHGEQRSRSVWVLHTKQQWTMLCVQSAVLAVTIRSDLQVIAQVKGKLKPTHQAHMGATQIKKIILWKYVQPLQKNVLLMQKYTVIEIDFKVWNYVGIQ